MTLQEFVQAISEMPVKWTLLHTGKTASDLIRMAGAHSDCPIAALANHRFGGGGRCYSSATPFAAGSDLGLRDAAITRLIAVADGGDRSDRGRSLRRALLRATRLVELDAA